MNAAALAGAETGQSLVPGTADPGAGAPRLRATWRATYWWYLVKRLVQAVVRMGFLGQAGDTGAVRVLRAGRWVGLAAAYGTAWLRRADALSMHVAS